MAEWQEFLNKQAKVVYEDGVYPDGKISYSKKIGVVIEVTATHILLKINSHNEAINLNKVLRIEGLENGK